METVDAIDLFLVDVPLVRRQEFAAQGVNSTSLLLVRMRTSGGLEGWGECTTPSGPWWAGESIEGVALAIDTYLADAYIGKDIFAVRAANRAADSIAFANNFAKATLEMALLDLQGKAIRRPVSDLLGGATRSSIECCWPLASNDSAAEIEEAATKLSDRFARIFKFKMGALPLEDDVRRVCMVASVVGDQVELRVDPNERWSLADCTWAIPRLVDAGIQVFEQPCSRRLLANHAKLRSDHGVAIILDEGVFSISDAEDAGRLSAGEAISIKPMKHGGLLAARSIADVCERHGMRPFCGTFLESGIGTAAILNLAATFDDLPYGGEMIGPRLLETNFLAEPTEYSDFQVRIPEGHGHGVTIDMDRVNFHRRDRQRTVVAVQNPKKPTSSGKQTLQTT